MTNKQKLLRVLGGTVLCLLTCYGTYAWIANRPLRAATALQDKLLQAGDISPAERNELKLQLMRTVDEMDRDKVRKLYTQLKTLQQAREAAEITAFHAASDDEKLVILDQALERWANSREVMSALQSDGVRRKRNQQGNRESRKKKRDELSEQEKAEWAQKKKLQGEYYQALKARAVELGLGDDRGKRKRG
jgi:hypothetical protein